MARIFGGDENQANTKRVVGTYGYMSPEYAMQGQFSEKSDVFSYGVLLLEIVSGRRNTSFYNNKDDLSLLGYAWKLWREGNIWGLVDKVILESKSYSNNEKEIWRCIHVGLLCVQEYTKDRPTISTVISMLNSEISDLNTPKQPAFTQAPLMSHDVEDRGILYHQIPLQTVVWVANRNRPLKDFSGILTISDDGNLVVSNGKAEILWSTNVTNLVPNATTTQLLDSGNLVLNNGENGGNIILWESFQHLSNVFLQTMKISTDVKTDDVEKTYYETYEYSTDSRLIYFELESDGRYLERIWDAGKGDWINGYSSYLTDCNVYGKFGAFGFCDSTKRPICSCLKGFKPRNIEEWSRGNWSSGCFRTTPLHCQRENNNGSEAGQGDDGFLKLKKMKNCSCVAYAYDAGIGCMLWSGDLIDVQKYFSNRGVDLYIRLPSSELDKGNSEIIVITTVVSGMVVIIIISALLLLRRMGQQRDKGKSNCGQLCSLQLIASLISITGRNKKRTHIKDKFHSENIGESSIGVKLQQPPLFNFEELATATNNFHPQKKLGQGGFGPVYKGTLDDGKEIAVKRLSKPSGQGLEEFMNEVVVISKLQHRNLVKLFGCCVEAEEKMLVYEFMPNKSSDAFLFDFGIARIFGGDENQANTKRVVGTYGYMSLEYAMHRRFSEKSNVFSYGVLLLEIVSGRRNISFYNKDDLSLLGFVSL
ncbi:hypothetical protein GOBAR_DD21196 [Gossypium barbadense]|nr:hypothetical protein GOBAR_DD21196 [Gossypium barbadense]